MPVPPHTHGPFRDSVEGGETCPGRAACSLEGGDLGHHSVDGIRVGAAVKRESSEDVLLETVKCLVGTGGNHILGGKHVKEGQDLVIAAGLQDLDHTVQRGEKVVCSLVD